MVGTGLLGRTGITSGRGRQDSCEMCESSKRCQRGITSARRTPGLVPVAASGLSADKGLRESSRDLHKRREWENVATSSLL